MLIMRPTIVTLLPLLQVSMAQEGWFGPPLNKAVIQPPPFLYAEFDYALDQALKSRGAQSWTVTPWKNNTIIPQACWSGAVDNKIDARTIDVANIRFSDCSKEWTICRTQGLTITWDDIASSIAKVPLGMRQYSADILFVPAITVTSACALADFNNLIIFAENLGCFSTRTAIHEFGHIMDLFALDDLDQGYFFSRTPAFLSTVDSDTHVVTDYANTNSVEDFAEIAAFAFMDGWISGGIARYIDASQKALVDDQLKIWNNVVKPRALSGNCDLKKESSQSVFKVDGHIAVGTTPGAGVKKTSRLRGSSQGDSYNFCGGYPLPTVVT